MLLYLVSDKLVLPAKLPAGAPSCCLASDQRARR